MNKRHDDDDQDTTILPSTLAKKLQQMKEAQDSVYSSRRERKELLSQQKQELQALVVNNKHQRKKLVEKHLNQKLHYKRNTSFKGQRQRQRRNLFAKQRIHKEETRANQKEERKKLQSIHDKMERQLNALKVKMGNVCIADLETIASTKLAAAESRNHKKKKELSPITATCDSKTKNGKKFVIENDKEELHDIANLIPLPVQQGASISTKVVEVDGAFSPVVEGSGVSSIFGIEAKTSAQTKAPQDDDFPVLTAHMGSIDFRGSRPNPTCVSCTYAAAVGNGPVRRPKNPAD